MSNSDTLSKYFKDVRKVSKKTNNGKYLTREEERELITKAKQGDESAKNILVCANLKFAISIARQYQDQGLTLEDLINEANIGLIKAATEYNLREDVKFITYAVWWIRQSILAALKEQVRTINLPTNVQSDYIKVMKIKAKIEAIKGSPATEDEIIKYREKGVIQLRHLTPNKVKEIIADSAYTSSLDDPIGEEDGTRIDTYIPKEKGMNSDDKEVLHRRVNAALACLSERDREVMKMFYGIGQDFEIERGNEYIAQKLGMTTVNVNKIIRDSLSKMRNFLQNKM